MKEAIERNSIAALTPDNVRAVIVDRRGDIWAGTFCDGLNRISRGREGVARFRHDPAYTVPPLPLLAVAAELARIDASRRGFAKTQLLRGQNRFVAALREAERIAARALHPSSA